MRQELPKYLTAYSKEELLINLGFFDFRAP